MKGRGAISGRHEDSALELPKGSEPGNLCILFSFNLHSLPVGGGIPEEFKLKLKSTCRWAPAGSADLLIGIRRLIPPPAAQVNANAEIGGPGSPLDMTGKGQ
jgi:hypothetical protein